MNNFFQFRVMELHLGKKIEEIVKEKGIKPSHLADKLSTSKRNIYELFKREDFKTSELTKISEVLDHDFFQYVKSENLKAYDVIHPEPSTAMEDLIDYHRHTVNISLTLDGSERTLNRWKNMLSKINDAIKSQHI